MRINKLTLMTALLAATAASAGDWNEPLLGPAEQMGREVGPYISGDLAGAATPAGRLSSIAVGVLGVHVIGDYGAEAGAGYGRYIDQTGNNPLLPNPISGHSPRPDASVMDSILEAFDLQ